MIADLSYDLKRERKMLMSVKDPNVVEYYSKVNLKEA